MSTTTPETNPPDKIPVTDPVPLRSDVPPSSYAESAPSPMLDDGPTFARLLGFVGLFLLVLGSVVVISTRALGPRMVPEGWGFLFAAAGMALMLYHATIDDEHEVRRMYGGFAAFWIVVGLVASTVPGPFDGTGERTVGHFLFPWGVGASIVGLLFTIPFCRHETDELYRHVAVTMLLGVGGVLAVGSLAAGVFVPEFLAGPGLALALLGLLFLCAYLGNVDTSDGIGYTVAFSLGAFGAGVAVYAVCRAAFPTLLSDDPMALRTPNGSLDAWKVGFRLLSAAAFALPAVLALAGRSPGWLKAATGAVGLAGVAVVVTSLFISPITTPPRDFLVPNGLILIVVGLMYTAVSVGVCSDNQLVTLTRRELSSYFLSPIGYLVLGGMVAMQGLLYHWFITTLSEFGKNERPLPEPIVAIYFNFLPAIIILLLVPALTMRLVSEEKRTGSMEVLFTAPVNEWPVVISKFVATWLFFLICWLPAGLFLVALRLEVPVKLDYLPLLSFYLCLAAQGLAFVGMGLFFSTLTKNQIVAAVLTFVGMFCFLLCFFIRGEEMTLWMPQVVRSALGRLSYFHMWRESLAGRLPLRDTLLFASLGVFWLFLSVKVLETRKWS